MTLAKFRRFYLERLEDPTGLSGTGIVAVGIQFPYIAGKRVCVTRWMADVAQTCVWDSIDEVIVVHGHDGKTIIRWLDE